MKLNRLFFLEILIFYHINLIATNYPTGSIYSDNADAKVVIYQNRPTLVDGDNVSYIDSTNICGFAWMKGGLYINDTSGTVDFMSPFPVGGSLDLDVDVTLRIHGDLILAASVGLESGVASSGKIDCNGNSIVLSGEFTPDDGYLLFVDSGARIFANNNVIDFSPGGSLRIGSGCTFLSIRSAFYRDVKNNSFQVDDPSKTLYFWNSILSISEDVVFDHNVGIVGDVLITGTHSICFNRNLNLEEDSRLIIDIGTTFSYGASSSINLVGPRRKGTIHFNGCNILIGDNDFNMDAGRIIFANEVVIDDENNHRDFVLSADSVVDVVANGRVVLENTTTFSIL